MKPLDTDVPIPPPGKYGWERMEAGHSFVEPYDGEDRVVVQKRVYSAGRDWCDRNRPNLRCRTRQEDEGVRVWLERRES